MNYLREYKTNVRLKGWWKYEQQTNNEIEEANDLQMQQCEVLICGELYVIDFKLNIQYQKHRPSRRRHIKRCLLSEIKVKGTAGIS